MILPLLVRDHTLRITECMHKMYKDSLRHNSCNWLPEVSRHRSVILLALGSENAQSWVLEKWTWEPWTRRWRGRRMKTEKALWGFRPASSFSQFSSVAQSYPTLCYPMNRSTPGLPVHHQLPEFTQTRVHWVGDAIQPSHPLSSPSPPALNLFQH